MHMSKYDFTYHYIDLVQKFIRDLYMDDTTNTFKDIETAIMFYNKIKMYLSEGRFELKKWETNDSTIRDFLHQNETSYQLNLVENYEKKGIRKVLELNWNFQRDEFLFEFQNLVNQANELTCTKRNVLKVGGSFFDPLEPLSPVTLQTNLLFKNICETKSDWDDDLVEPPLCSKWKNFVNSLKSLTFSMPRCVFYSEDFVNFIELHGFADSSNQAYLAVIYARLITKKEIKVKLLTSKTCVAPAKPLTIPRLELLSCLLLSKLIKTIYESNRHEITIARTTCCTDSKIAFYWITQKYKDWKPWFQNRVNRINEVETVWKHVPGYVNQADIATREINLLNTSIKDEWFSGPQFLLNSESKWQTQEPSIRQLSQLEMKTETMQLATKMECKDGITTL